MKFLITGGAGFIGSNFLHYAVNKYPDDEFVCLDSLTYAGNFNNLKALTKKPNYRFVKGDIRNSDFIESLFDTERFDYVINFAAESHVDNSIKQPNLFAETNILGVMNLMNAARKYPVLRFHQVSTDEVYGDLPLDRPDLLFTEDNPLKASSPYSASKAGADLEVMAFHRTFGIPVTISRCSNNYGPYQFPEKLIPVVISRAIKDLPVPIYGDGKNVRDWIHVYDHNVGVDLIVRNGRDGEIYNLGGRSEKSNLELAKIILKQLGKPESLIQFVKDRPGHDLRYAINSEKAEKELGWRRIHDFESGIKATVDWYLNHQDWIKEIESGEYQKSYTPQKIAIIGANSFQNKLISKAQALGYETHVFAWEDDDIGERTADYFYPISITEKDQILKVCQKIKPSGVCSIASDLASITVDYVAEKLGLPCNPTSISKYCTNKYEMRKKLQKAEIKTPRFLKVTDKLHLEDLRHFTFPIIVKPTDRSGSRGVTKVESRECLEKAIKRAQSESFERSAIIEEYINGDEYSCECISENGKHYFLAFTKKYTTGSPNFIETGHLEPANIPKPIADKLKKYIFKALDALGVKNGASHTEFKLDQDGDFCIIEIGARMGGDCIGSDLVKISTGIDFTEKVIDVAVGKKLTLAPKPNKYSAIIKFIFNQNDLKNVKKLNQAHPELVYYMSDLSDFNHTVKDSSSRIGFVIYKVQDQNKLNKIRSMLFHE